MSVSPVDIIIPVYNAYEDLQRCVESVQRFTCKPHRIVLINDCSPDSRISQYFNHLRSKQHPMITLLENDSNQGFVHTTNRGMALSKNDVILLNSDTIVTKGWVDKIIGCAQSDSRIGTITPFSNNAEICSFPHFCVENELPQGMNADDVNSVIEAAAVPVYPDLPTGVGFCMYIRRGLLDEIGLFDAETFSLGYGEENDLCMRAKIAGWRNVLCDDTFIQHVGKRSFDAKKQELVAENLQKLQAMHPDYGRTVREFIAADPIKPIRQLALSYLAMARSEGRPGVLHIMHGSTGGGTEQHLLSLLNYADSGYLHYQVLAVEDVWYLKDANGGEPAIYRFDQMEKLSWGRLLTGICSRFNIQLCHIHHLVHCRAGLLEAVRSLSIPYGFTAHDFHLACPTIHLLDADGFYCGSETDPDKCQQCLSKQTDLRHIDIEDWRYAHQHFIDDAKFVITPSDWAVKTLGTYFPGGNYHVIPHGVDLIPGESAVDDQTVIRIEKDHYHNIGVLGAVGPVKGARQVEQLVRRTRERDLPLRWIVVGYMDNQYEQYHSSDNLYLVHGQYDNKQVDSLLDHYGIKLVVFPSAGPETYCYTLTETWFAGRPALVPGIGTLSDRVGDIGAGWIMTNWRDPDAILDDILNILDEANAEDYTNREAIATNAGWQSIQDMASATEAIYNKLIDGNTESHQPPLPNNYLYKAIQRGLGRVEIDAPLIAQDSTISN